jgi:hypothetical protein
MLARGMERVPGRSARGMVAFPPRPRGGWQRSHDAREGDGAFPNHAHEGEQRSRHAREGLKHPRSKDKALPGCGERGSLAPRARVYLVAYQELEVRYFVDHCFPHLIQ